MSGRIERSVPILRTADARIAMKFYEDGLGFKTAWVHQFEPGFPLFVAVERDGIRLFLTEHPESAFGALVYFYVDDVDALARFFSERGVDIGEGPVDQPWKIREICVNDPDGNVLRFGQPL